MKINIKRLFKISSLLLILTMIISSCNKKEIINDDETKKEEKPTDEKEEETTVVDMSKREKMDQETSSKKDDKKKDNNKDDKSNKKKNKSEDKDSKKEIDKEIDDNYYEGKEEDGSYYNEYIINETQISETQTSSSNSNTKDKEKPNKPIKDKDDDKKPKEKDKIEKKTIVLTTAIPFNTIDKYQESGGKTKVIKEGENGYQKIEEEITYKNGKVIDRKEISKEIVSEPVDKIIARYIKIQDEIVEEIEVEDKDKPIYDEKTIDRWLVIEKSSDEKTYFYDEKEALDLYNKLKNNEIEVEIIKDDEITKELVGYEKTVEKKIIQEEKWEWKY